MKASQKWIFLFALILISGGFFFHLKDHSDRWDTFTKDEAQRIRNYPTTETEKEEAKLKVNGHTHHHSHGEKNKNGESDQSDHQDSKRHPASQKKSPNKKADSGRRKLVLPGEKFTEGAKPLNRPHKEWKKRLGADLLRFMRPETKVFLKKIESLTLSKRGHPFYVEKVHVKMATPEGRLFSYNALVDSETGKIVETWNKTNHEHLGQKKPKLKPTGALTKDAERVIRF